MFKIDQKTVKGRGAIVAFVFVELYCKDWRTGEHMITFKHYYKNGMLFHTAAEYGNLTECRELFESEKDW